MRIFVPDEEGEALGDTPVVVCSEVAGNPGPSVAAGAKRIRASVMRAFRMPEAVWIEHRGASAKDGVEEALYLVNFPPGAGPERKPLDRASVERLVGRELV